MTRPNDPDRQCHAKAKTTGERCGKAAIPGGTVCRLHGGMAPRVQRKAAMRLLDLVDRAIGVLAEEMENPDASAGERIRAAENVLDRAGYPRRVTTDTETAREMLIARLIELRDRRASAHPDDPATATIVGEVVPFSSRDSDA